MNEDKLAIDDGTLDKISGLPPPVWWLNCKTSDQKEHWREVEQEFQLLYLCLKSYFSGEAYPLQEMAPKERENFEMWVDYYILLYAVIQKGWSFIAAAAVDSGLKADLGNTPGEALFNIIKLDCAARLDRCFQYEEWSQDTVYRLHLGWKKIQKLELATLDDLLALSKGEQNRIRNSCEKLDKMLRNSDRFFYLRDFCIAACRKNIKLDHTLRRRLEAFDSHRRAWTASTTKNALPESHGWDGKGNRTRTSKAGGTYR